MESTQNGGVTADLKRANNNLDKNIQQPLNGSTNESGVKSADAPAKANQRGDDDWEEISIAVPWGTIAGKWWGPRNKQPILALHGWQDNCGTFDRLCPLLPADMPVLAIDMPGHGKSSPYPKGMQYYLFWDGVCVIRRIVKKFGWKHITLMGHSMGGALSFIYAASYPDEVDKLINIDIAGPPVRCADKMAASTGKMLDKFLEYETLPEHKLPCYSYKDMIALVLDAYAGAVDEASVKILMKRGMLAVPAHMQRTGYHFSRDLRLKVSTLALFSTDQVYAYTKCIRCKVLNIRADPGREFENPEVYDQVIELLRQHAKLLIFKKIKGPHHLHLVNPESVAPDIISFLLHS